MKKSSKKIRKIPFLKTILIVILILIILSLFFFILLENKILENPIKKLNKKVQDYSIKDYCTMIAGNLIHTIANEEQCRMHCVAECEVRKMSYINSQFKEIEGNCNNCNCQCK